MDQRTTQEGTMESSGSFFSTVKRRASDTLRSMRRKKKTTDLNEDENEVMEDKNADEKAEKNENEASMNMNIEEADTEEMSSDGEGFNTEEADTSIVSEFDSSIFDDFIVDEDAHEKADAAMEEKAEKTSDMPALVDDDDEETEGPAARW